MPELRRVLKQASSVGHTDAAPPAQPARAWGRTPARPFAALAWCRALLARSGSAQAAPAWGRTPFLAAAWGCCLLAGGVHACLLAGAARAPHPPKAANRKKGTMGITENF